MDGIGIKFLSEVVGTAVLVLLGTGVVANVALTKTKGFAAGTLMVTIGWGFAVFAGVTVSYKSGAHLNPAVSLAQFILGNISFGTMLLYWLAQMIGAVIGAVLCWLAYRQHFDQEPDPAAKLGVFSTGPAIRNYAWNLVTEIIGTFVLVFVIIAFTNGKTPAELGAIPVAFLVIAIGVSLGGPTGYAINPARDLGPRIAHAFLPIRGKGSNDWAYAWVPVVGPLVGGALAAVLSVALLPIVS
ncbi:MULTISPECIES: MIP/aquaporin family protein [unclassified Curtobacterium]|uniref:MIP/aquaporin family protein n=1 Tax=unclassified Curtobacterium TaxID=257496 RepID=UPI000DAA4C6B|nr:MULTISPECIES: MIP/aquaporin family protein [unclassified Curtobacterium]PZE77080.1 aquaporin family protein [Curtobacterium sp. MCBD17_019]WIB62200.1 MIP/aquaporin family protein [Curtobacterium sp. MCBD17_040]WIE53182.1 MIP/aquaporin family protein [Curtobacterium sp. MCBD17_003]